MEPMEEYDEVLRDINVAYFGANGYLEDPRDLAAVLMAHAEDHDEEAENGNEVSGARGSMLVSAATLLVLCASDAISTAGRLITVKTALAVVKAYREFDQVA